MVVVSGPARLTRLRTFAYTQSVAWAVAAASLASTIYVTWPRVLLVNLLALCAAAILAAAVAYLATRPAGRRLVWPGPHVP